jgi:kinesin family protein 2/24
MVLGMKDDLKFNVDKRTSRKENAEDFQAGIWQYRQSLRKRQIQGASAPLKLPTGAMPFKVFARKRPIFDHELAKGEYDTVTCEDQQCVTVHKCNMKPDLKHMYISHKSHYLHGVFSERASNRDVFEHVAGPLLDAACSGHTATLLMYGQTGSGKTHTINGVLEFAAEELFRRSPRGAQISLSSLELCGNQCFDLLNDRQPLHLREDSSGLVNVAGLVHSPVRSGGELLYWISQALAARKTYATHVNACSSRSHWFNRVTIHMGRAQSVLSFVDLAGSERNEDTMWHDADRRKESAQINSSLAVLKQCIRLQTSCNNNARKRSFSHVPYRESELTRLLKDSFTSPHACSALIATISPNGTDTEHTLDTLAHATTMASAESFVRTQDKVVDIGLAQQLRTGTKTPQQRVVPPNRWSAAEVQQWLHHISRGCARVPKGTDGKQLVRMSEVRFVQACNGDRNMGATIFESLQEQIRMINDNKVASAKASREAQIENKHMMAVKSAGLRFQKAPQAPTVGRLAPTVGRLAPAI